MGDTLAADTALDHIASTLLDPASGASLTLPGPGGPGNAVSGDARAPEPAARRYEAVGRLGEGGMGTVERVRDRDLLRDVAVKHLKPDLAADPSMLSQFLWEARITAHLDHPNIVPVHDVGFAPDRRIYFTMKLVRGATLDDAVFEREPPSLAARLRLFLSLCNAVAFAHARGVLHRDLKPENVMIGEFGEVLVTDWGLAAPLPGDRGDALRPLMPEGLSARSAGTPMYMSPEQARGEALDERSDVYALGVILYEIASRERAFEASTVAAILGKVMRGEVTPFAEAAPGAPPSLASVVGKAMALDPADRYPTVKELAHDVETVLDGRTPEADKAGVVTRAARYYVAHDPAIARMRVVDIDMWCLSACLGGAGAALLVTAIAGSAASFLAVALAFALAAAVAVPPTRRWLAYRRDKAD